MIKKAILIAVTGALFITSGCAGENSKGYEKEVTNKEVTNSEVLNTDIEYQNETITYETSTQDITISPTLGGISLGDSPQSVIDALGNNYSESTEPDIAGLIGEDLIVWSYDNGIVVYIGKTSEKVQRIETTNPDLKTDLGIKVGDDKETVYEVYKPNFEEAVSRQNNEALEGWFLTEDESVIIFDFDKSDNAVVNKNVTSDSKVEKIILAYWKHFN